MAAPAFINSGVQAGRLRYCGSTSVSICVIRGFRTGCLPTSAST